MDTARRKKRKLVDPEDSGFTEGQKVIARWKDCNCYSATVIDILPNDILKIRFDDDGIISSIKSSLVKHKECKNYAKKKGKKAWPNTNVNLHHSESNEDCFDEGNCKLVVKCTNGKKTGINLEDVENNEMLTKNPTEEQEKQKNKGKKRDVNKNGEDGHSKKTGINREDDENSEVLTKNPTEEQKKQKNKGKKSDVSKNGEDGHSKKTGINLEDDENSEVPTKNPPEEQEKQKNKGKKKDVNKNGEDGHSKKTGINLEDDENSEVLTKNPTEEQKKQKNKGKKSDVSKNGEDGHSKKTGINLEDDENSEVITKNPPEEQEKQKNKGKKKDVNKNGEDGHSKKTGINLEDDENSEVLTKNSTEEQENQKNNGKKRDVNKNGEDGYSKTTDAKIDNEKGWFDDDYSEGLPGYVQLNNQLGIVRHRGNGSRRRRFVSELYNRNVSRTGSSSDTSETSDDSDTHSNYVPSGTDSVIDDSDVEAVLDSDESTAFDHIVSPLQNLQDNISPSNDTEVQTGKSRSNIVVACTSNTVTGRKWDKKHYCLFCENSFAKIPRHLESAHHDEVLVQEVLGLNKKDERFAGLCKLRNLGNNKHNNEVKRKQEGTLIVAYRPTAETDPNKYFPCPSCYAWYSGRQLHKHKCILKMEGQNSKQVLRKSRFLLPVPDHVSAEAREIFAPMRQDEVVLVAKNDKLICELARQMYSRKGGKSDKAKRVIRSTLRLTTRLLLQLRNRPNHKSCSMLSCIDPKQFRDIISAARVVAGFDENTKTYAHPENARTLGMNIKKCALIAQSLALEESNSQLLADAENFIKLYELNYCTEISAQAMRNRKTNKRNKPKRIPLTKDVLKLSTYLNEIAVENKEVLKNISSTRRQIIQAWNILQQVTLTQIITFNRRREGEVSQMTVSDYLSKYGKELRSDIEETLSDTEKYLCKLLTRVEILGKGDRVVPVLLTPDYIEAIELLLQWRNSAGVNKENLYLFPRSCYGSKKHIRGADCLRKFSTECGAQQPENIRSTLLRKHVATLSQVLNLKEHELDLLAKFMGHDIRIHRSYYRLPDDTLQIAKLAKLFLALEKGTLPVQQGKSLDEIEVSVDEDISDVDEDVSNSESEMESTKYKQSQKSAGQNEPLLKKQKTAEVDVSDLNGDGCNPENEEESTNETQSQTSASKSRPLLKKQTTAEVGSERRKKWNNQEIEAVERHLLSCIVISKLPGADIIRQCLQKEPALKNRSWRNVKDYCRWRIDNNKKIRTDA